MQHSFVKNWIHLIWTTKIRERNLHVDLRVALFNHLVEKAEELNILIEKINVQPEHIHLLFNLQSDKKLKDMVKQLKGESSRWINENGLVQDRFQWQRGYGAFSVSASQIETVKNYIHNQDEHHSRRTFTEEYDMFIKKYGFDNGNR